MSRPTEKVADVHGLISGLIYAIPLGIIIWALVALAIVWWTR